MINWLGQPFPTATFNEAQKLRSAQSGSWFLNGEHFKSWKTSSRFLLWLHGIPGSGKTVLCSSIVEDLERWCGSRNGCILVYFFFDFTAPDKAIVRIFLQALLAQIVVRQDYIPNPIQGLYHQNHEGIKQ